MKDEDKIEGQLISEISELRQRVAQLEASEAEGKRTEELLEESEEKWRSLVKNAPDIIMIVARNGTIRFINHTVPGITQEQAVGMRVYDYIPSEHHETMRRSLERVFQTGEKESYEITGIGPRGTTSWYESHAGPLKQKGRTVAVTIITRDITERKLAQEALQESEETTKALLNAPTDSALLMDRKWTIIALNETAAKALGKSQEDLIGSCVLDLLPPNVAAHRKARGERVIRLGKPVRFEDKRVGRWFDQIVYPIFDDRGKITRVAVFAHDITEQRLAEEELKKHRERLQELVLERTAELSKTNEQLRQEITTRKQMEEVLRESEQNFKALAENANDGILIAVGEGDYVYVNNRAAEITGYSVAELLKLSTKDLTHPDEFKEVRERYRKRLMGNDVPRQYETAIVRKDGNRVPIEVTAAKTIWWGQFAGMAIIRDISERKRAEEKLREGEKRFSDIAENALEWIWEVDLNGKYTYASPVVKRILGYNPEEVLKKHFYDLFHHEDREGLKKAAFEIIARKQSFREFINRNAHKNGTTVWLSTSGVPILDAEGNLLGYRGADIDITDRKRAEEQLGHYSKDLEKLVEERTVRIRELELERMEHEKLVAQVRMVARIAHEINNPLGGIKNSFLLIKDAIPEDHTYYRYVKLIEKEIDRISRIVCQMFDLDRLDQETSFAFSVKDAIDDVVTLLKANLRKSGIRVEIDTRGALGVVTLPEASFWQILYNLLLNAIDASPPEGIVRVEAKVSDEVFTLTVSDEGSGIPEEIRSWIFEPFFTTKQDLKSAGLGLSISKNLVEGMKGSLDFESKTGHGTCFRITLPLGRKEGGNLEKED